MRRGGDAALSFAGWWRGVEVTTNKRSDQARGDKRRVIAAIAVLCGVAAVLAAAAVIAVSAQPGLPELVPGQQRLPPASSLIKL